MLVMILDGDAGVVENELPRCLPQRPFAEHGNKRRTHAISNINQIKGPRRRIFLMSLFVKT